MEAPREEHLVAVKRILHYVARTRGWGVRYSAGRGKENLKLVDYSDSDMAGDVDDRKNTSGMIYFLSGGAICWQSTKQKVVALSSCEAEYIVASTTTTRDLACATDERIHRKRRRSTNTLRGQQIYDLPNKKSDFARPEQAHRDQVPLHSGGCRLGAYQD